MPTDTASEKRQYARYEGVFAEYAIVEDYEQKDKAVFKSSFLRNFSLGGMSLYVYEDVPDKAYVLVHLYDPNSPRPLEIFGGIVWTTKTTLGNDGSRQRYNIGIKFLNLEKDVEHRLKLMSMYFEFEKNKPQSILDIIQNK